MPPKPALPAGPNPNEVVGEFQKSLKKTPIKLKYFSDSVLQTCLTTVPILALAVTVFLGNSLYHISGLQLSQSAQKFDRWHQMNYVKAYCWGKFEHVTDSGEVIELWHYSSYPLVLFAIGFAVYSANLVFHAVIDMDHLSQSLQYVIEGLEECIRDLMIILLHHLERRKTGKEMTNSAPKSRSFLRQRHIGENCSTINQSAIDLGAEFIQVDAELDHIVRRHFDESAKFVNFNRILRCHSNRRTFSRGYRHYRCYLASVVLFAQTIIYRIYLLPANNPFEINCPLPPDLYIHDSERNVTTTSTKVLFTATGLRTRIIWFVWLLNCCLIGAAFCSWARRSSSKTEGMQLIHQLPVIKPEFINFQKDSDLAYLMKLMSRNKHDFPFIKLALNVLKTRSFSSRGFLSSFQELIQWSDNPKHSQLAQIARHVTDNLVDARQMRYDKDGNLDPTAAPEMDLHLLAVG